MNWFSVILSKLRQMTLCAYLDLCVYLGHKSTQLPAITQFHRQSLDMSMHNSIVFGQLHKKYLLPYFSAKYSAFYVPCKISNQDTVYLRNCSTFKLKHPVLITQYARFNELD